MKGTYLKGVQANNYVWYNGFLWRIMGKNEDGSIKLITEENVVNFSFGLEKKANWNSSGYIKDWLNIYFLNNLDNNKANIIKNSNWYQGMGIDYGVKYDTILGDVNNPISAKVGLIRVGEMLFGQSASILTKNYTVTRNASNAKEYWMMNKNSTTANAWCLNSTSANNVCAVSKTIALRPVILVGNNTIITTGNGTL